MPAESPLCDDADPGFGLIETMRWEPEAGFPRLDRHMARLAASARELGFATPLEKPEEALACVAHGPEPLRVRLELAQNGAIGVSCQPFSPLAADTVWRVRIAATRLDAADPLLRHKTTRRDVFEAARTEYAREEADEVLLLNQRGELCEGTITSLFADFGDGVLSTPPLACGLLPGVLRAELLGRNRAVEQVLRPADLDRAESLYVGNSLRGLIRARIHPVT